MRYRIIISFLLLTGSGFVARAQGPVFRQDTTIFGVAVPILYVRESQYFRKDTLSFGQWLRKQGDSANRHRQDGTDRHVKASKKTERAPLVQFNGGYAGYHMNYRSLLDTPYSEKNILQQQVLSSLNFTVAGVAPIRVNSFVRRSNSFFFRNITDVQVSFDPAAYRNMLVDRMRQRLLAAAGGPDSLLGQLHAMRFEKARSLRNWLDDPLTKQKMLEANEVLKVPGLSYDMHLPDSTNRKREDSLRAEAALLVSVYKRVDSLYGHIAGQRDSLARLYQQSANKSKNYQQLTKGPAGNGLSFDQWRKQVDTSSTGTIVLSGRDRWLLGVRSLGLGRNNINTSELTARNLSLNGLHFEYNSWYFIGVSAGLIDYRYRDLVVHRMRQPKQYMYLFRAGLGKLEGNYVIASVFGGQKQLLTSVNAAGISPTIRTTGLSVEAKWQIERHSFVIAEAAESFSPALPGNETTMKSSWSLSDKSNKALSLRLVSYVPSTNSRFEAQYKFTGANYQSFNSFQTNSQLASWYLKGDQYFFGRQLKLTASIRSNDFSNPYIIQRYQANTVFKSIGANFRRRGLPILTLSYMPMSQLTKVGDQLEESRFQTLNAGISHFYKLGQRQASTNIIYTKMYNNGSDSGFIYYNAVNLYAGQTIFFRDFTATVALSQSQSTGYRYNVLEGNISVPLTGSVTVGMGAKLNQLNQSMTGVGGFADMNFTISPQDKLSAHIEKGYLPGGGTGAKLVPNVLGTVSYMRLFK